MKTKLILIEGIPGSGKSTIAKNIGEYLSANGIKTTVYTEGQLHPVDLAWCACIPIEYYNSIISKYPQYQNAIRENTHFENNTAITAYTKFTIKDPELFNLLESYEIFNGRVGFDVFSSLFLKRWGNFAKQAENRDEITVFECAYLQNQLCELIYFHNMDPTDIEKYMLALIDTVKNLNPIIFYLNQPNVSEHIRVIADKRVNANGEKDWLEKVILYTENSPYGKMNNLKGFNGVVQCFEIRKQIELNLIKKLPITTYMIDNQNYNWNDVWNQIEQKLDILY
jgi:hypothetical protein